MKVVTPKQMSALESEAYRSGASESDFMEEAGSGVALVVHDYVERNGLDRRIILFCGKGNNAGDAYVAGIHLLHLDYEVIAYQLFSIEECSPLCRQNQFRFQTDGGKVLEISSPDEVQFPESGVIIDGIFGTGFEGEVKDPIASIIEKINHSFLPIMSIDIPSGLNGETGEVKTKAVKATITTFLGLPKTGFFLRDGWLHSGKLAYIDFGLPEEYIQAIETDIVMMTPDMMQFLFPPLNRVRHKYEAGLVVGFAGSPTMPGAAILSSLAALRGGAGVVQLLYPKGMESHLSAAPYELIRIPYSNSKEIIENMNRASAVFVGPGLGLETQTRKIVTEVMKGINKPCVLDGDALTMYAEDKFPLPEKTVLTPHMGEFKRLMGIKDVTLDLDFLWRSRDYASQHGVNLVLKGSPTFILTAGEPILVNPFGDPGMATAGSGDVLTGLIASMLAQGLPTRDAAVLSVYLHSLAGEFAAEELTSYCVTASDIISYFPDAFIFRG